MDEKQMLLNKMDSVVSSYKYNINCAAQNIVRAEKEIKSKEQTIAKNQADLEAFSIMLNVARKERNKLREELGWEVK